MQLLTFLAACTALAVVQGAQLNMLDALVASRHNVLVDLIKAANLTHVFKDPNSNVTAFVPIDRNIPRDLRGLGMTIDQLKADKTLLTNVLTYHVIPGAHLTKDFINERMFKTVNGARLRLNHYLYNNRYFVDGSYINRRDLECTNGILHQIDHLIFPMPGNIYDVISNTTNLKTLKAAIDAVGLDTFLTDYAPLTMFAPTDDAFALLGSQVQTLLGKPDLLREILKYHVIPGSLYRGGMHDTSLHTFEEADQSTLYHGSLDAARFKEFDISADNGVIHKISQVLIPDSLKSQL